jgi:hypothetical protein
VRRRKGRARAVISRLSSLVADISNLRLSRFWPWCDLPMLRERAPLEHGAHSNGVLEELGARMIDPTGVVEFVQKIASDRLKAPYVLRTHLRSPVSEPGRRG